MTTQRNRGTLNAALASKNKNFDLLTDNENNNNLEISIYLDNLNPPYKNALFCDDF